jgi:hypothetical protein
LDEGHALDASMKRLGKDTIQKGSRRSRRREQAATHPARRSAVPLWAVLLVDCPLVGCPVVGCPLVGSSSVGLNQPQASKQKWQKAFYRCRAEADQDVKFDCQQKPHQVPFEPESLIGKKLPIVATRKSHGDDTHRGNHPTWSLAITQQCTGRARSKQRPNAVDKPEGGTN